MPCWSMLWLIFVNLKFFYYKLDFSFSLFPSFHDLKQMFV